MMTTTTLPLSSHPTTSTLSPTLPTFPPRRISTTAPHRTRTTTSVSCATTINGDVSTTSSQQQEDKDAEDARIGARVRVKVPLKVFHVPRIPEVDLTGMEGELKQYVGLWKGKRISANLPYKVLFFIEVEGRGPVKFFAHLKEDEFEYVD